MQFTGGNMEDTTNTLRPGLFIMMKYPEVGNVKSRLAESVGDKVATNLYRAFIHDTLTTVRSLNVPFHIAVYPPDALEKFSHWLGLSYEFFRQEGKNLGERLQNGFALMFKNDYREVIAIGSDSPDLPPEILQDAITSLQTNKVVIGPAKDGGYYLLGFSHDFFVPDAFSDVSWGTETVFQETLDRIRSVTNQVRVLPEWMDIDTKNDLRQFYETYKMKRTKALYTMKFLRSHPDLLRALFA
ncbi:MAG: TIGR04282 family arsenosugar biosynthesis glycosyltransferase [Candidatus Thorarchaeota archaeon]